MCGGRDYGDVRRVVQTVRALQNKCARDGLPLTVIAGGARGADRLAADVARDLGINVIEIHAQWDTYGRSAGFRRNAEMIHRLLLRAAAGDRIGVTAFPGGRGTEHTCQLAEQYNIRLVRIKQEGQ